MAASAPRRGGLWWRGCGSLLALVVLSSSSTSSVAFGPPLRPALPPLHRLGLPCGITSDSGSSSAARRISSPCAPFSTSPGVKRRMLPPALTRPGSSEDQEALEVDDPTQPRWRRATTRVLTALRRRQQRRLFLLQPLRSSAMASPPGESGDAWGASELPSYKNRPDWAPAWVPTWAVTLHPVIQVVIMVALYFFHMLVLSKVAMPFPFQLVPNNHGLFQSIGMDSLAGLLVLGVMAYFRRTRGLPLRPVVFGDRPLPFNPPKKGRGKVWRILALLMVAYLTSGSASKWVEDVFGLSEVNVALGRAVQVLAGHLVWVFLGVAILKTQAGGKERGAFFGKKSVWMKSSFNTYWLWWAIGGYYVSSLAFHVADTVNQVVLPASAFEVDSVVTQMINPEGNDVMAMLVGSLAPCVSAPWWEEVLYRGFLLPALYLFYPPDVATLVSAVIFAAHHMSMSGMIPLTTLGYLWAVLYLLSGNLLVPIAIHSLWNSRVFLGSLLGI